MTTTRRPGRLAALLPGLLLLAAVAAGGGTTPSSDAGPVVDLRVTTGPVAHTVSR